MKLSIPPYPRLLRIGALATVGLILIFCGIFVIRHTWFELYQIPTGSMRPTFREGDHLLVNQTAFGINIPLTTSHAYFDPSLIQRTGIIVWSGDGIDTPEGPTKQRYIKRLLGKPGDTLYFYGGRIYGIDREGRDISNEFATSWMQPLEYVPFSNFEGRLTTASAEGTNLVHQIFLNQMGQAIGRLTLKGYGVLDGEIPANAEWISDAPLAPHSDHPGVETYSDFWGIRNFAMARLLTKEEVRELTDINPDTLEDTILYLELRHTPSLTYPKARFQEGPDGRIRLLLTPNVTVIPLEEHHLARLMDAMYTSRFVVRNGRAALYSIDGSTQGANSPLVPLAPDGTYEFYYGKAYAINWSGEPQALDKGHPLYRKTPTNIQRLFNLGIEFDVNYAPTKTNQVDFPARFAYFRNGDLYVMGAPIILKDEPTMEYYVTHELNRQKRSPRNRPYTAFLDKGPPIRDGKIDKQFIHSFGLAIPENKYLVLGDNHARSADSRYFGFIPADNIQGAPSYILWPPGGRWGVPDQPSLPWATLPRAIIAGIVWLIAAIAFSIYYVRKEHPHLRFLPVFSRRKQRAAHKKAPESYQQ